MPLPDAIKRSPRVYTLLQNQDLENITADTLADVADPIAIEEANEDELRRLCLVAFARMVTKGSFDGWLSAGGGGGDSGYGVLRPLTEVGAYDGFEIGSMGPWGTGVGTVNFMNMGSYPQAYPFVSPKSGEVQEIEINVHSTTSASTAVFAIYAQDEDTHMPSTMLGYVTFDTATSTGAVSQTSFTGGTPNLTAGTQYWVAYARGTTAYAAVKGNPEEDRAGVGLASSAIDSNCQGIFVGNWATANPVDDIGAVTQYTSSVTPRVFLKW